ncbi:MAG: hypothetical protein AAB699_02110 [Patescibacteria group bacterium]
METARKRKVKKALLDLSVAERLAILRRARAVWSKRKVDPIKELNRMRRERR